MAYSDDLLVDVKNWLELGNEQDTFLALLIDTSVEKVVAYTNITKDEIDTVEKLYKAIMYDAIIAYNKRFSEGKKSTSIGGVSETYELDKTYKMLIASVTKIAVI